MVMGLLKIAGIAVGLILVLGVYILAFQPNYLPQAVAQYHEPTRENVDKITAWTSNTVSNIKDGQLKPLGQVVQTSELVGVDKDHTKTLPQKAFEYGRYQYCQQVIKEYDQAKAKNSSQSNSSSEK